MEETRLGRRAITMPTSRRPARRRAPPAGHGAYRLPKRAETRPKSKRSAPTTRRQNIIRKPAIAASADASGMSASGPMYTLGPSVAHRRILVPTSSLRPFHCWRGGQRRVGHSISPRQPSQMRSSGVQFGCHQAGVRDLGGRAIVSSCSTRPTLVWRRRNSTSVQLGRRALGAHDLERRQQDRRRHGPRDLARKRTLAQLSPCLPARATLRHRAISSGRPDSRGPPAAAYSPRTHTSSQTAE